MVSVFLSFIVLVGKGVVMIFGAILAGGVGSRMDIESMPKQFLPLGERPILIHTLEKFCLCGRFDALYVGVHKDWITHTEDLLTKFGLGRFPIEVICGGNDRNGTIMNILDGIEARHGSDETHVVVTHDSVRPFVKLSIIEENIDAALRFGACDTVIPATDTIVQSEDGGFLSGVPSREHMYQGQTPQSFNVSLLKELYAELTDEEKSALTDACKVLVMRDKPVKMVTGDVTNIKLTTIMDYKIAQAMIESKIVD